MKSFICPELEGATDYQGARLLITQRLFPVKDNDAVSYQDVNGNYTKTHEREMESGQVQQFFYSLSTAYKYFESFEFPSGDISIADLATTLGITIETNFTLTDTFYWNIQRLSELYKNSLWFVIFAEDRLIFAKPSRATTSVYRGSVSEEDILSRWNLSGEQSVHYEGETADITIAVNTVPVCPTLIDDELKTMALNKYNAAGNGVVFRSIVECNALDWIQLPDGVYIIMSRYLDDNGEWIYAAVRETAETYSFSGGDVTPKVVAWCNDGLQSGLNADMLDSVHLSALQQNFIGCSVRTSGTLTMSSADTFYKVQFNTEDYDYGNYWDTTNYKYLPLIEGSYHVDVNLLFGAVADQNDLYIGIYKNGALYRATYIIASKAANTPLHFSCDVPLDGVDDYVEIYAKAGAGLTNRTVITNQYYTKVDIHLAGKIYT